MDPLNESTVEEIHAVRHGVGLWLREDYTFIRFAGKDAVSWLHSQTTNDVEALRSGEGHHGALLDRQGRLQAHFTLHRWDDELWMLIERGQAPHLLEQLDAHLFIEDVQMEETGGDLEQMVVQGPNSLLWLASFMDTETGEASRLLPADLHGVHPAEVLGFEVLAFRASPTGEDGYVFVLEKGQGAQLFEALLDHGASFAPRVVGPEAREVLRIEAGIPRLGVDMDTTNVLPETTLERECVSYEKGCYLGQEVIARLKAYGSVKQALMGLIFRGTGSQPVWHGQDADATRMEIFLDRKRIGHITSACYSPTLHASIALAYLDREHRTAGDALEVTLGANEAAEVEVRTLPLWVAPSCEARAHKLYGEALERFQADIRDEDESAISLLKEAILLESAFEDAYEVLGVILHRQSRTDEAIHYMQRLAELNPDCLMAHTNLSVFYVAKGMIQEAEEEKAKAAVLEMQKLSDDRAAKSAAEAERRRLEDEARERIGMFKEVLDIDPDDAVATFGLGRAYIQLQQFAEAVPHLRRATEVQKDFSAAWLELGKCHEFLGQRAEATETYHRGIASASRKGDLIPLREMERRLKALDSQQAPA